MADVDLGEPRLGARVECLSRELRQAALAKWSSGPSSSCSWAGGTFLVYLLVGDEVSTEVVASLVTGAPASWRDSWRQVPCQSGLRWAEVTNSLRADE